VVATNKAKQLLVIECAAISRRVTGKQCQALADIACAGIRQATGTVDLELTFYGSLLTFPPILERRPSPRTSCRSFQHPCRCRREPRS
jgi:hypothetical protein